MKTRKFTRTQATRSYNKRFLISTEGDQTEPQYFSMLNKMSKSVVKCLNNLHGSSPLQILKVIKEYIKKKGLGKNDEAWLVVDRDKWEFGDLNELVKWSKEKENYNLALSNPKFEYWLLLHFEEGKKISSSKNCSERLKKYLPNYNKEIQVGKIKPGILEAISRAQKKDTPKCLTWPEHTGTTVYRLVEKII